MITLRPVVSATIILPSSSTVNVFAFSQKTGLTKFTGALLPAV
jgi:hypothetical protein